MKLSTARKFMLDFMASTSAEVVSNSDLCMEIKCYFNTPYEDSECFEWWLKR